MSPLFAEDDSPLKKTVMIVFWIVCAIVAVKVAAVVLSSLGGLIVAAAWIAFWIGPALWVFWHAQKNDVSKPFLWALLTLFTWLIGLVVYLIVHSDDGTLGLCPRCGARVKRQFQRCPECGSVLTVPQAKCPSCGRKVEPSWEFCAACGGKIT